MIPSERASIRGALPCAEHSGFIGFRTKRHPSLRHRTCSRIRSATGSSCGWFWLHFTRIRFVNPPSIPEDTCASMRLTLLGQSTGSPKLLHQNCLQTTGSRSPSRLSYLRKPSPPAKPSSRTLPDPRKYAARRRHSPRTLRSLRSVACWGGEADWLGVKNRNAMPARNL